MPPSMTLDRLLRFVRPGMSFLVGSVDAEGTPACCRAIAVTGTDDLASVTIYVPVATAQQTIANLATTRRAAVVAAHAIDVVSLQIKGTARTVRIARPDEEPLVAAYRDGFAEILDPIGIPRQLTRSLAHWPAYAIELDVHEMFDQTPGPRAGAAIP